MKHVRELMTGIKKLDSGIQATVLRQRSHVVIQLEYQGRCRKISVSTSPSNTHHAVDNALKDVRRYLLSVSA
jgi:hypothetical protein